MEVNMREEYYHLTYWSWNNEDSSSKLCVKLVLVPASTMMALTTTNIKPAQALRFIIGDGEDFILKADNFYSLERVYGKVNSQ
jgi:hypothetical protein